MLPYLYWPLAVALMAWAQGLLMPAIRRTPPGAEASRQAFALHWLLTAAYFLPLALSSTTSEMLRQALLAVLSRLLLFDPVLNLAAGDAPFAVGQTAVSDRAMQWLAQRVGWPASRVRLLMWVLSVGAACYLLFKITSLV